MTDAAYLTLSSGTSRYLTQAAGTSRYLTQAAGTQYYLTLQDPVAYVNDAVALLAEATWYIDAHQHSGSETITNLGTAGTALNALNGGGTAITTNDAKWLAYSAADGPYVYLPGVALNYLSTPDAAALDVVDDIDIRVKVAMDAWVPSVNSMLVAKSNTSNVSYRFVLTTAGLLRFQMSTDGSTVLTYNSSVTTGITDGAVKWVRVTRAKAAGEVKFWTSDDNVTYTQLGTTVTGASTGSMYSGTAVLEVGRATDSTSGVITGKFYRAQVYNGIAGTKVLDVDTSVLTSASQTTFTEQSSNAATVTVNRSTSGRKTTLVGGWVGGGSKWLLGTDDYMEVPDNAALNFGASDSFTVLAVTRLWATNSANRVILGKRATVTDAGAGWLIRTSANVTALDMGDGSTRVTDSTNDTFSSGSFYMSAATRGSGSVAMYVNAVSDGATSDTTTGSLSNTDAVRVGRLSGAGTGYIDMEFMAACIWRRVLTAAEISALYDYFTTRAYNG